MNNDNTNNDPILDWILQNDSTEDTNKPISTELLSFLLTQNVNTDLVTPQQQQQQPQPQQPQQVSPVNTNMNISSPSEEDDELTDAQLKMMPSKERRQLRNKISARNFRNRRKEYMATLEAQMDQCKAENSQLKLEVKWVRGMMDKLQAENDRLRLELVLCKEGIQPPRKNIESSNNTTTTSASSVSPTSSNMVSTDFLLNNNTMTTTTTNNNWDMMYPPITTRNPSSSPPSSNSNNIYLAHASLPNWDMSSIFAKENHNNTPSTKIDLIRTYPLLAPALMSIVLNHTMTMTTDDIISNSKLYDPTCPPAPSDNTATDKYMLSSLSDTVVWQKMLQQNTTVVPSDTNKNASQNSITEQEDQQQQQVSSFVENYCPLYWIQKQFCNFVISYVVVRYPHLDSKCRTYLPICEKFRNRRQITQLV